jgi:ADP-dependent NAD(P)H-hydrate dehydratase
MPSTPPITIARDLFATLFAPRQQDSHKGTFGTVAIIGGGYGMVGAPLLAGRTALKGGAGKVLVGFAQATCPMTVDTLYPELMLHTARHLIRSDLSINAWVMGCGLGQDSLAQEVLQQLFSIRTDTPLVLDADGLNLLATQPPPDWGTGPVVLTPHPTEAARLLGCSTQDIQANRLHAAHALAVRYQAWVVLKGAGTLVHSPDGLSWINRTGNPGLATAGTGDVLAGLIGSLLAQRLPIAEAVTGAVWLHGSAADFLVDSGIGPIGLTAGELADAIRQLRNCHT